MDKAENYVNEYPDEPAAHFALALLQLEENDPEAANETIDKVLNDLGPSPETIAEWVDVLSSMNYDEEAILLYLTAIASEPDNGALRELAGAYIYTAAEQATSDDQEMFCDIARQYTDLAFVEAILAQSLLTIQAPEENFDLPSDCLQTDNSDDPEAVNTIEALIRHSFELDPNLAEGYLILGNYYEIQDEIDQAIENWTTVSELPDVADWVKTEAQTKIETHPN
jgi:tetratricopeptide (TPR) repeat protein